MTYRVWLADEHEDDGKSYHTEPNMPGDYNWAQDTRSAATMYADYCHSNRDGWEWSWPVDFLVRDTETGVVERFNVERESVPEFHASRGTPVLAGVHDNDECECRHPFGFEGTCDRRPGGGKPCECHAAALGLFATSPVRGPTQKRGDE